MLKYCAVCGGQIPEPRASSNAKYCCTACRRKGTANKTLIASRAKRINKVAHSIYRAYGCKCALCGWQASSELLSYKGKIQYSHGNEIHHITPVREGGTEDADNLILLCPNHHAMADLELISRDELRTHTREYIMTPEEIMEAKASCADSIASAIGL